MKNSLVIYFALNSCVLGKLSEFKVYGTIAGQETLCVKTILVLAP
jgi:hypothetical protein